MKKTRIQFILNIVLSIIIAFLLIHIYRIDHPHHNLNVYYYYEDEVPLQNEDQMQLCIIKKEKLEEAIGMLAFYRKGFYFQANKDVLEPLLIKEKYKPCWNEIKTNDLSNYDIEGYFAYTNKKEIYLIPHYVEKGYHVNLKEEFNHQDMMPYTMGYLDNYMDFYFEEPLAKQRQVGFISNQDMFAYVEMKLHNIMEIKDKYSNMYACYVRTTKKNQALKSIDMSAKGTYYQGLDIYPKYDMTQDYIDVYDYFYFLKKIDLGGKVKMKEQVESIDSDYHHAYQFSSNADTFAGVIQIKETDLKDKNWELDASITWNLMSKPFTLTFKWQ